MVNNELDTVASKLSITEKLHEYCRGMDRVDDDLALTVFHPDAELDYGDMYRGSAAGFVSFVHDQHLRMQAHHHQLGNVLIHVSGDQAGSECYVTANFRIASPDGKLMGMQSLGRYVDQWLRKDGVWRISRRNYIHEMDDVWEVNQNHSPQGKRDKSDVSYGVFAGKN